MANEISISANLTFTKGGASISRAEGKQVTVAGDAFTHQVQLIAEASPTALLEGDAIGSPGYIFIKNLDDANTVSVGLSTQYSISLKPSEFALFRAAAAIYAQATTADCLVEYVIIEE